MNHDAQLLNVLLLAVVVLVVLGVAVAGIYWLRQQLSSEGQGASAGAQRILLARGAACWVELLASSTLASASGGWPLSAWKQLAAHLVAQQTPCPSALRERVEQALEQASRVANDAMITAYIQQIKVAMRG
jgi:hypothetical protein